MFEKPFKKSRIEIDDQFINRVVPEILEHSPELKMTRAGAAARHAAGVPARSTASCARMNADQIAALAAKTSPTRLWDGPFVQLGNSQVEASFADHRTYFYKGKEVDQQVHLGFDLAVTAARAGRRRQRRHGAATRAGSASTATASIIDHGMGVQSLYGHLSSFDVKVGDTVTRGQTLGRSGMTGLAGGDHLHFTMLVGGQHGESGRMVGPALDRPTASSGSSTGSKVE